MKYRIVGADGKTYGPVELEQLQAWLAEGRIEGRTPVHVEGASAWITVAQLPGFAPLPAAASPPTIGALTSGATFAAGTNGFATAGLVCGLLSWLCCCCVPMSLLGLLFSIIALVQLSSQPVPQEGRAFAICGLILSGASLILTVAAVILNMILGSSGVNWQAGFN
jgi:hypothetical protein